MLNSPPTQCKELVIIYRDISWDREEKKSYSREACEQKPRHDPKDSISQEKKIKLTFLLVNIQI